MLSQQRGLGRVDDCLGVRRKKGPSRRLGYRSSSSSSRAASRDQARAMAMAMAAGSRRMASVAHYMPDKEE